MLSMLYPCLGYSFHTPSYARNGKMPFLSIEDVLFYYQKYGDWTDSEVKRNLLRNNLHFDKTKISTDFFRNVDPVRWLDNEERADWVKPNPMVIKYFSEEEIQFRNEYVSVIFD